MKHVKLYEEFVETNLSESEIDFLNEIELINELSLKSVGVKSFLRVMYSNIDIVKKMGFRSFKDLVAYIKGNDLEDWDELRDEAKGYGLVITESTTTLNEAKKLDRDAFMALLKDKYKFNFIRTTEEFDGSNGGVWVSGEDGQSLGGKRIFNYYAEGSAYELGVLKRFEQAINKLGWYSEWYDTGTMMIWPE